MALTGLASHGEQADPLDLHGLHRYREFLVDSTRQPLLAAIANVVQPRDVVLDIGTGVGQLALAAAARGATVLAVEDDTMLIPAARMAFREGPFCDNVTLYEQPLSTWSPPQAITADVLICDIIGTWLLQQPQLPLVSHYRQFLRPGGRIIPERISNRITLSWTQYEHYGITFKYSFRQRPELPWPQRMTEPSTFSTVEFAKEQQLPFSGKVVVRAKTDGRINSAMLESTIEAIPGLFVESSPTSCRPIVVPLPESTEVRQGDEIEVSIAGNYASAPSPLPPVDISVRKVSTTR